MIMESQLMNIKMELDELMTLNSEILLSPAFEDDSFGAFVLGHEGDGAQGNNDDRRRLAQDLLELLEKSQKQRIDEPYNGWLEEPMDLEIFGQSLVETAPLDEAELSYSGPSSPVTSQPATPIHPATPQGLYPSQDELPTFKFDPSTMVVPAEGEKLLRSWESLLSQAESTVTSPLGSPETSQPDDDIAAALLDSLIYGDTSEDQDAELADFSLALMEPTTVDQAMLSELTNISTLASTPASTSSSGSESEDGDWSPPPPSAKKNTRSIISQSESALRKPRRKSLKVEDRRIRKKEQNKTAATRYRIKKRAQLEILQEEEAQLEDRNRQLQAQYDELANEVHYLKKLMREVFSSRAASSR